MSMTPPPTPERLVKSVERVRDLGEVFTPAATVKAMLDLIPEAMWVPHPSFTFLETAMPLDVRHYLYLSGTPFRALTEGEFLEDQVYNWTYSDEQRAKTEWKHPKTNPYAALPQMILLAYEMPEALKEVALNNHSEFSLTEFFRTKRDDNGTAKFIHEHEVQKWLDVLRGQDITGLWANVSNLNRPPLPYEDTNLLRALQHTVWYLPSVDACTAMCGLLTATHNTFYRDYQIVVAAGSRAGMGEKALPPVKKVIGPVPQDSKSITLSCGKLMTGVTVPAWTGILMLRELKSPESYFQAAFRVQSPWVTTFVNTNEGARVGSSTRSSAMSSTSHLTGLCVRSPTTPPVFERRSLRNATTRKPSRSSWNSCRYSVSTATR